MKRTKFKHKRKPHVQRITRAAGKAKGRELQQWACQQISDYTKLPWGKDCPIESRPMGQSGVDVRLDRQARERFPFSVESKRHENWSVPSWVEQAKKNELPNTDWLLVMRRSHKPPVIVMDGAAFFKLLERLKPWGDSS